MKYLLIIPLLLASCQNKPLPPHTRCIIGSCNDSELEACTCPKSKVGYCSCPSGAELAPTAGYGNQ